MKSKIFLPAALLFLLTSCDTMKVLENTELLTDNTIIKEPEYVMSFHEIVPVPHTELLETELELINGKTIIVNVNPLVHTRHIKKVEMLPMDGEPEAYNLAITFDRRGKMLWSNLALSFRRSKVALVIDGIAYKTFEPSALCQVPGEADNDKEEITILLRGPFDKNTAGNIADNSEHNYKHFNN